MSNLQTQARDARERREGERRAADLASKRAALDEKAAAAKADADELVETRHRADVARLDAAAASVENEAESRDARARHAWRVNADHLTAQRPSWRAAFWSAFSAILTQKTSGFNLPAAPVVLLSIADPSDFAAGRAQAADDIAALPAGALEFAERLLEMDEGVERWGKLLAKLRELRS